MIRRVALLTTFWWILALAVLSLWIGVVPIRGEEKAAELAQITVTATRTQKSAYDVAGAVSFVTEEELWRRQPFGAIDALYDEVAIVTQRTTNGQGSPTIRSFTGYHTLLLIDGVRLNNSTFRSGPNQYFNTLSGNDLSRIEIVRGPSSVLYGNSALGGVIAAYSVPPRRESSSAEIHPRLFARWGSVSGDRTGGISAEGGWKTLNFRLSLARSVLGDVQPGKGRDIHVKGRKFILTNEDNENRLPKPKDKITSYGRSYEVTRLYDAESPTNYTESSGSALLDWRRRENETLRFAYQGLRQRVSSRWDKIASGEEFSQLTFDPQERHLAYLNYRVANPLDGIELLATTLSFHRQKEGSSQLKVGADPSKTTRIEDTVDTLGVGGSASSTLGGRYRLTYGFDFYHDHIASEQLLPTASPWGRYPDGSTAWDVSGFVQGETALAKKTLLTLGANGTYYSVNADLSLRDASFGRLQKSGSAMTGVASLSHEFLSGLRAYGSVGQGFRAPSLDDLAAVQVTNQGINAPSPDVKPERGLNLEAGIKWNRPRLGGSLTVYQNTLRGLMVTRPVENVYGSSLPKLYQDLKAHYPHLTITVLHNLGRARIRGVEFETYAVPMERTTLYALGSVMKGEVLQLEGRAPDPAKPWEANLRREMPPSGTFGARWEPSRFWIEAFVRGMAKASRLSAADISDPRIPGYTRNPAEVVWDGRNALNAGTPGWFTVNLRGGAHLADTTRLVVALENALNRRYRIHTSGVDAPGRNIVISLESRL